MLGVFVDAFFFLKSCLEATHLQLCHMSRIFCVGRRVAPAFSPFRASSGNFGVSPQLNGEVSDLNHSIESDNLTTNFMIIPQSDNPTIGKIPTIR